MGTPKVDERLGRHGVDEDRASRMTQERAQTDDRTVTDQERLEAFRNAFNREILPDLPPIPGYHVCWLSTTNQYDSIPTRIRLGYELIQADELGPRFIKMRVNDGADYAGCIMVKEMVAAKLPEDLYRMYMLEAHHHGPNQQNEKLASVLDSIQQQAQAISAKIIESEGMADFRKQRPAPKNW